MLVADGIGFSYGPDRVVLRDASLGIARGERVALCAPSGAGKTTLCRILAGYLKPDTGRVLVDGVELRHGAPNGSPCPVQLVWQHPEQAFDPHARIERSLAEAGDASGGHAAVLKERLGVRDAWLGRFPHELSGGELMRCCLMRALMVDPAYLIADESTAMLDMVTQAEIWHALAALMDERGFGMLVVSHSEQLLRRIADRRVELGPAASC